MHATVMDDKNHLVTNLDKSAFTVFENNQPQTISSFRHEDIPVAMGIVIDNSGSMREKRDKVNKAALNLVRSSNPRTRFLWSTLMTNTISTRTLPVTSTNCGKRWRRSKPEEGRRFTTRSWPRPTT